MDIPTEIFDKAVQISATAATKGHGNALDAEISKYLSAEASLNL